MAVDAKKMGLYGAAGVLVACLMIAGLVISGAMVPSLRLPGFVPNTGTLVIKLTDAPVDLDELWITIESVSAHRQGSGWQPLDLASVNDDEGFRFDLLTLQDVTTDLSVTEVPSGIYTMIKMKVSAAEAVYASEDSNELAQPLKVPSEAVRVIVHLEVRNDEDTTVTIDMDVDWVAISRNNVLRPVLKVVEDENSE